MIIIYRGNIFINILHGLNTYWLQ